ncbi:MAG: amidohydrolase [Acidobacteriota bacterium]|nr:amidohydrolase [Acidobacteriota bacterium]
MSRKYQVISGDGHVETPPDPWVRHVPEKYRDRAPRLIKLPDGHGDAWMVEGQPLLPTGQNITGPGPIKFADASYTFDDGSPREGTGDARQRLEEQDRDGIDAEVLFPPVFATRFIEGISDRDVYRSIVRAYNTFLAEDYCSVAPDRLIGSAFVPVSGIDDAIAELEYAKAAGLKSVTLQQFPNGTGKPSREDDRFWERALELGMALSPHISFGDRTAAQLAVGASRAADSVASAITQHTGTCPPAYCLAQMIMAGVFDRFPEIRFYFAEINGAHLPAILYYMDRDFTCYNEWFQAELPRMPSEYIKTHCLFGIIRDPLALRMGDFMPLDWFMWGSDFPHSVGTYPRSRQFIDELFADVDEKVRRRILLENPAEYFGLDLDADITPTPTH